MLVTLLHKKEELVTVELSGGSSNSLHVLSISLTRQGMCTFISKFRFTFVSVELSFTYRKLQCNRKSCVNKSIAPPGIRKPIA